MNIELLGLLAKNARYTAEELAAMLGETTESIEKQIKEYKKAGIICGYRTVIDWDAVEDNKYVSAIVELKVTPKASVGYEETAMLLAGFKNVEAVYLMSGAYDLHLTVKGKSLKEIAFFIAHEVATLDGVTSTATHFVMRRYKELDTRLLTEKDDREQIL